MVVLMCYDFFDDTATTEIYTLSLHDALPICACAGTPYSCNDGNVCTDDACDPVTGCSYTPNTAACDDGNACTVDNMTGSAANCNVACGQIDIGNALTPMAAKMTKGVPQADGSIAVEPVMDVAHVASSVLHMASLPLEANVQFMTVMATNMPFIGRG